MKLSPDRLQGIIDSIRQGAPVEVAARSNGIHEGTFYQWMREGRNKNGKPLLQSFYHAVQRARVDCERAMAEKWRNTVVEGMEKRTTTTILDEDGEEIGKKVVVEEVGADWRGIAEFLLRRYPERWKRSEGVEHSGPNGEPIQTSPIPLDRLSIETKRRIIAELEAGGDTVELEPTEYRMIEQGGSKVAPLPVPDWCDKAKY